MQNLTRVRSTEAAVQYQAPFRDQLPYPLYFRFANMPGNASYPLHRHPWGEFVYSYSGMMEISLSSSHYLAPPQYAVWLPPGVEHRGLNRYAAVHCSLYVDAALCADLPEETTALEVTPLLRSMLEHLRSNEHVDNGHEDHLRFLHVVVDLVKVARHVGTYLPWSNDHHLDLVLSTLNENPADNRSLAELARIVGIAERTLIRRCLRDLGMPFAEWKQRLRVTRALPLLEANETIETVGTALGYSSASSFIAMFKRMTGSTPDEYRTSARR
ncbi:helix-turn-helix domain-containing protein [Asticcacaulis sp. W401b]|uniref:AraC family transcriptional regulator n=1 Tax=Asticcacaulis sp. W401b TaxID=3388666 RepID=UPI003970FFC7